MKKQYTNAEKILYFEAQLVAATEYYKERKAFLENKIASLKELNASDHQSQNWNSDLEAELKRLRKEVAERQKAGNNDESPL